MKSLAVILVAAGTFTADLGEEATSGFRVTDIGPTEFQLKCQADQRLPLGPYPYYRIRIGNEYTHFCMDSQSGKPMFWMDGRK